MALLVIAVVVGASFFGIDLTPLLTGQTGSAGPAPSGTRTVTEADKRAGQFVSVVLADTEDVWGAVFKAQLGKRYDPPVLVLFKGATTSPCGGANEATGPFYCPGDQKIYLDTDFFTTMERQLGAKGDFAQAYVVAHEVGHHVQDEMGILRKTNAQKRGASTAEANAISVRVELMADCLAGIWAKEAEARFGSLEPGDIAEAMNAAGKIGDDTLQKNAGRRPMPDSFTHGTSAQRQRWFERGYERGGIEDCDTLTANRL